MMIFGHWFAHPLAFKAWNEIALEEVWGMQMASWPWLLQ